MIEFFIAKKHIIERKKQSLISVSGDNYWSSCIDGVYWNS